MESSKNAHDAWWRGLTRQGDPIRRPHLVREAFHAGYEIAKAEGAAHEVLVCLADAVIRDYENLEDRAPTDADCQMCTAGAGPNKRTCAYHQAKAIIGRGK